MRFLPANGDDNRIDRVIGRTKLKHTKYLEQSPVQSKHKINVGYYYYSLDKSATKAIKIRL